MNVEVPMSLVSALVAWQSKVKELRVLIQSPDFIENADLDSITDISLQVEPLVEKLCDEVEEHLIK